MKKSGVNAKLIRTHSLREGVPTANSNSPEGGGVVVGFMGLYLTKAGYGYIHFGVSILERSGWAIGLEIEDLS